MIRRILLRIRCWLTHHDWFEFRDYELTYRTVNSYVIHRSCHRCGLHHVAIPMPNVVTTSAEGAYVSVEWVGIKAAQRIMDRTASIKED